MMLHRSAVFLGMAALAAASFTGQCGESASALAPTRADGGWHPSGHVPAASFGAAGSSVLDAATMRALLENYAPAMHLAGADMPACKNCHGIVASGGQQMRAARIVAAL